MIAQLQALTNSIAVRVIALIFIGCGIVLLAVFGLMQTPLSNTFLNRAIKANSGSIAELVWLIESAPRELESFILSSYDSPFRLARIDPEFSDALTPNAAQSKLLISNASDVTSALDGRDIRFGKLKARKLRIALRDEISGPRQAATAVQVGITLQDRRVLNVWLAPAISLTERPIALLTAAALILIFAVLLGLALSWVIMRPIRLLEHDAERVGLAETAEPISLTGPVELRRLSAALNRMRLRLNGLIREREQIVAAIAHDIRTGLTRLRLRLADRAEDRSGAFDDDFKHMEKLISDMLMYARAESPVVDHELIRLGPFMENLAAAFPVDVRVSGDADGFTIAGNAFALRRLFENLLENARRYGHGEITIALARASAGLQISIEDDGPGIPKPELESVFEPFKRGESSRSRETGGSGLGLGIARAIARNHGANITLANRRQGGLRASVFFPSGIAA
ncbi:MAG: ATP-binding protein [Pseudomonadota bacterium]